jgi:hypothetical protein
MSRKINALVAQLALTDPNTSDFLDLSKKIAETFRLSQKEKAEKPPKTPKAKVIKIKEPRTILCDDCADLLIVKMHEILPEEGLE